MDIVSHAKFAAKQESYTAVPYQGQRVDRSIVPFTAQTNRRYHSATSLHGSNREWRVHKTTIQPDWEESKWPALHKEMS